ncbi:MAG TPA: bifunctional methylenetetrahydrofolate dehydrogenase/methenyltetrahydrofolate cyclohydrolase FolD [Acidimicrobiia bacterium]|jgi:methylenetetrahydrofolate dehydrogenase (NADP+)/methenyltetrahydrofolate cyclohydrolase|nr:bifunctional methylenetetrahydrofolate dehydrogenase/methenyltetrahydrofolate cyclohydrolase [Acidimicrobiia bacterium]HYJ25758.1 bifunctional methylenetetrahydrofolate dehydrogenase/methenyltetrahydrofolate cyclohydrolase FolD [Acidimicrobiia bacterium]
MSALILDGKESARKVKSEVSAAVADLDYRPGLATVLVGDDPASHTYVRGKRSDAAEVGILSFHHEHPADIRQDELEDVIAGLNEDNAVDGILVQLPLPEGLDSERIVSSIDPAKDVDGLHPHNLGLLLLGRPGLRPCTPSGIMRMLEDNGVGVAGKTAVVIGRSFLVGRPLALMMATKGVDATVTMAHSRTPDLVEVSRRADILVAAIGVPRMVNAEYVKPGAAVIDVGISRVEDGLAGDVDFESVREVAGSITPVPGGVGPMTRAMLLVNTLEAARNRRGS